LRTIAGQRPSAALKIRGNLPKSEYCRAGRRRAGLGPASRRGAGPRLGSLERILSRNEAGTAGDTGSLMAGTGGAGGQISGATFPGRSGATKSKMLKEGGGNDESERAVARGLAWLARQQKQDGSWEYDQGEKEHRAAATGMALLPFLAARLARGGAPGWRAHVVAGE
jgi:hypothetical protein